MRFLTGAFATLSVALAAAAVARPGGASPAADEFVAAAPARGFEGLLGAAVASITAQRLAAHVAFLASPAIAGRGLGTRDLEAAGEYVATTLALAGVAPAGAGGPGRSAYFQAVPLRSFGPRGGSLSIERAGGDPRGATAFAAGRDWIPPEIPARKVRLPVVFAGHGLRDAALGHDDYRGLDVRGQAALVLDGVPDGPAWRTSDALARHKAADEEGRWDEKLRVARELGAAAVLAARTPGGTLTPPQGETDAPGFFLPAESTGAPEETLLVPVSWAVAEALLGDTTAKVAPSPPRGSVTLEVTGEERRIASANVLGVIPGSDPALAGEVVVIGAHLDHLGVVGGSIHPGADDNASGVAALLEIAAALAASPAPPRRTVLVAFWTGEEEGKLGSGYYVRHPLVPLARTVAYVNLDMIGHAWSAKEIRGLADSRGLPDVGAFLHGLDPADFVEPGVPPGSPVLEAALRHAAAGTGLALRFDRTDGKSGGSDYRDFARAGVPFVRLFGTFFDGYHEPGDTPERLDAAQIRRVARLALATAWHLANP